MATKKPEAAKEDPVNSEENSIVVTPMLFLDAVRWLMDHRFAHTRLNDNHVRLAVLELLPDPDDAKALNPLVFQSIGPNWESAIVMCHHKFKVATKELIASIAPNTN